MVVIVNYVIAMLKGIKKSVKDLIGVRILLSGEPIIISGINLRISKQGKVIVRSVLPFKVSAFKKRCTWGNAHLPSLVYWHADYIDVQSQIGVDTSWQRFGLGICK